jgi:hypothetical protein
MGHLEKFRGGRDSEKIGVIGNKQGFFFLSQL